MASSRMQRPTADGRSPRSCAAPPRICAARERSWTRRTARRFRDRRRPSHGWARNSPAALSPRPTCATGSTRSTRGRAPASMSAASMPTSMRLRSRRSSPTAGATSAGCRCRATTCRSRARRSLRRAGTTAGRFPSSLASWACACARPASTLPMPGGRGAITSRTRGEGGIRFRGGRTGSPLSSAGIRRRRPSSCWCSGTASRGRRRFLPTRGSIRSFTSPVSCAPGLRPATKASFAISSPPRRPSRHRRCSPADRATTFRVRPARAPAGSR